LCRQWISASGFAGKKFDVGAWESEAVILVEVDAQGRRRVTEVFAPNHLGGAAARLYERYAELLSDGPERTRATATARTVGGRLAPPDPDRFATPLARGIEFIAHRPLGFPPRHGAEQQLEGYRNYFDVATDIAIGVDDILSLAPDRLLVRWTER